MYKGIYNQISPKQLIISKYLHNMVYLFQCIFLIFAKNIPFFFVFWLEFSDVNKCLLKTLSKVASILDIFGFESVC
jgi:hypothetical protein